MTGEKALTSLMYVQMTLYAAKKPENVCQGAEARACKGCATWGFI